MTTIVAILTALNTAGVLDWLRERVRRRQAADVAAWAVEQGRMLYRACVAIGIEPARYADRARHEVRKLGMLAGLSEAAIERAITIALRELGRLAFEAEAARLARTIDDSTLLDPGPAIPRPPGGTYRIDPQTWTRVPDAVPTPDPDGPAR